MPLDKPMLLVKPQDVCKDIGILRKTCQFLATEDGYSSLCYVAAPFAGTSDMPPIRALQERTNVDTARHVGRFLLLAGLSLPIVPHNQTIGLLDDSVPSEREKALALTMATMLAVKEKRGYLVVVVEDDGTTRSAGVAEEVRRWRIDNSLDLYTHADRRIVWIPRTLANSIKESGLWTPHA